MTVSRPVPTVQLLDPAEVAELMHVDVATISRWTEGGKLTLVQGRGGQRRFARDEVMRLVVDVKRAQKSVATRVPRTLAPRDRERDVTIAEAALDVDLTVADVKAAAALTADAAVLARLDRAATGREAAKAIAKEAAQDVVAARFRADAQADRVREAAARAVAAELEVPGSGEASALERAARTASMVEATAAAVVVETAELAAAVARTVAMAVELVESARVTLDRAIEAEVAAAASAIELRAMAAAHVTAEDVAVRLDRAAHKD